MNISLTITAKRTEDKSRPLLASLSAEFEKLEILSRLGVPQKQEQYSRVYITPDRIMVECHKHRKSVGEMKCRNKMVKRTWQSETELGQMK